MKKYIPYETETSTHLELDVYYNLGGTSYFSGEINKRGIYFHLRKITLEGGFKSFSMFGENRDFKYLLEELNRSSNKKLKLYESKFESIDDKVIIDLYERQIQLETFLQLIN